MRPSFTPELHNNYENNSEAQPDAKERQMKLEKFERCAFCNSKLIFSHDMNLSHLQVIESSRCAGCGVTMHPKKFTLQ